jgi:hypothetical protein
MLQLQNHVQGIESGPESAPFSLDDPAAYGRWRARKLADYPRHLHTQRVAIAALGPLQAAERARLHAACRRANFAVYATDPACPPTPEALSRFAEDLGLKHHDRHLWAPDEGIVALRREAGSARSSYIPYTDRPMNWHTDGYYNRAGSAVGAVIMHCVTPAAAGGGNWLLDPEMLYIAVRDTNPAFIAALMQPDAMTIPENRLEPGAVRPAVSGPVFSVHPGDGSLHMRYTARTRSIQWKNDALTREAVACLQALLSPPVKYAFRVCLAAGEGIVCNNVLHNREGFSDGPDVGQQRLLWRARYRDRIAGT